MYIEELSERKLDILSFKDFYKSLLWKLNEPLSILFNVLAINDWTAK